MNLDTMHFESRPRVKLFVTKRTFEVLGPLMLNENFIVVELSVAVPAPRFNWLLLFLSAHDSNLECF